MKKQKITLKFVNHWKNWKCEDRYLIAFGIKYGNVIFQHGFLDYRVFDITVLNFSIQLKKSLAGENKSKTTHTDKEQPLHNLKNVPGTKFINREQTQSMFCKRLSDLDNQE